MKTVYHYKDIPEHASYIGGEDMGGWLDESTADRIDQCMSVICLNDEGIKHYFSLEQWK
jgi:hypothetical protein